MWKLVKCSISFAEGGVLWPRVASPLGDLGMSQRVLKGMCRTGFVGPGFGVCEVPEG